MNNNSIAKNALLNAIKQVCAILFPLVSFIYCSRILGRSALGAYSFGQSIVAYFLLLSKLGIPDYAIREGAAVRNNNDKLQGFINEVFSISVITTILSYVILIVLLSYSAALRNYKIIIMIQSVTLVLNMFGIDWVNTIFEDYFYLTIRYIIIQAVSLLAMILLVKSEGDIYIYTIIAMLSNAGGNILNWYYLRKRKGIKASLVLRNSSKKHLIPILILFCNSIASVIYLNSDITMLGMMTDDSQVGIYTVSTKIYSLVKTLINAVVMVTVPRFSFYLANGKPKQYKEELKRVLDSVIILMLPVMVGIYIEAEKILLLFAGKGYVSGSIVVKILSVSIVFSVGACFYSYSVLLPNHMEKYFLLSTTAAALINIILNFVLIPLLTIKGAAITTLIAEITVFILSITFSNKVFKVYINLRNLISVFMGSIVVAIVCLLIDKVIKQVIWSLLVEVIVSIVIYFIVLTILRNSTVLDILERKGVIKK